MLTACQTLQILKQPIARISLDKEYINPLIDGFGENISQKCIQMYISRHLIRDRQERNQRLNTYVSLCIGLLTTIGLVFGFRVEQEVSGKLLTQLRKLALYTDNITNSAING